MRAAFISLMCGILAAGAADAKVCPLDGLEFLAEPFQDRAHKALAGAKFRVRRQASDFRTTMDKGYPSKRGSITVELTGDRRRFIVEQDYEPTSSPWVTASSWAAEERPSRVKWGKRDRKTEAELFSSLDVYDGPLAGLILKPVRCR